MRDDLSSPDRLTGRRVIAFLVEWVLALAPLSFLAHILVQGVPPHSTVAGAIWYLFALPVAIGLRRAWCAASLAKGTNPVEALGARHRDSAH